jgi:predicted metal-dependent peptidase
MTDAKTLAAEGRIKLALERVAVKYPFHAALISRFRVTARASVGTTAVTVGTGDELLLLHNPDFVLAISVAELVGLLLHETHHVLFGHLTMRAADYSDRRALTVAQEVTANEFICEPLPGDDPVTLAQFPMLPARESTAERYRRLSRLRKQQPHVIVTVDNHEVWAGDAMGADAMAGEQVEAVVAQAVEDALADPAVAGVVPAELQEVVRSLIGRNPGADVQELSARDKGHLNWRRLLRRYVGQALEVRPVYHTPPRRFPDLVGILPGRRRQAGQVVVLAVIDTSGSVGPTELEAIGAELARISRTHLVRVVECDCQIQRVYRFTRAMHLRDVHGRGGTDFRPALEATFLRRIRAELVVYFTDGAGPAPERPPHVPVIWCLVDGGQSPAAWGRVVCMR